MRAACRTDHDICPAKVLITVVIMHPADLLGILKSKFILFVFPACRHDPNAVVRIHKITKYDRSNITAGSDEQNMWFFFSCAELQGIQCRQCTDRHRQSCHHGLICDLLCELQCTLENDIEVTVRHLARLCGFISQFCLTDDLHFAKHRGFEAANHLIQVFYCCLLFVTHRAFPKFFSRDALFLLKKFLHCMIYFT